MTVKMNDDSLKLEEGTDIKHIEAPLNGTYGARFSTEDVEFLRLYEGFKGKKVIRKMDIRIVPVMALLYLCSHIDRGNIGNAKIEGMDKAIGLTGNQYNIASTIFFVPYIIFEIPSNIVLKKVRPSFWLTFLMVSWGIVMTLMGIVKNFAGMAACRIFLGLCEAGFFPGAVYLVSTWYPRHELQQRLALFYTASAFSGALSGLLAYAIADMNGLGGIAGWRWIFLLEGAATIVIGLAMPLLISDSPERASWLTDKEKRFIDLRLRASGVRTATGEGDKFSWKLLLSTMVDWKILLGILVSWANSVPNSVFKFTLPQILTELGFVKEKAQLLTIPPYFCGGVSAWLVGRYADRFAWRAPFILVPITFLVASFAILFSLSRDIASNVGPMYFAIVLAQISIYPLLPGISAWVGNNLAPSWKRSIGLAWLLAAGNFGSIIGTNIFLDKESPTYPTGYGVSLGICILAIIAGAILEFCLWSANRTRKRISEIEIREKYTQEKLDAMGENSPLYKYTL
ncbi:major facilitator superfamily domain-containing protein [Hypoxylon trugodes]|uniref:major facilitator superfamily domain-containing protein n=1 Tax=Hypoxylon trugodes TaxID=326681 RepID=UPI00218DFD6A|nr:major facilitator superfamily domain-containing protein [Hypoxylon trugodes]KAI1393116.1 major facilitator superfamily domain-containing protein [Hypoxylon trugodes]